MLLETGKSASIEGAFSLHHSKSAMLQIPMANTPETSVGLHPG